MNKNPISLLTLIIGVFALFSNVFSQELNPGNSKVFLPDEVSVISITMFEGDKYKLLYPADVMVDTYYKADFHLKNTLLDTTIYNVGIRIRGNTSRHAPKKSLKIDFKEYGGEQFFKLKKLNLKPNNNDPSQLREYLTELLYRNMNVPAARSNYTELFINGEYMGIFLNVEQIDDEFVDRRFGNESGNLFKCIWGATLDKSVNIYNNVLYELKTNAELNDRSKLNEFVLLLDRTLDANWNSDLEAIFDVDLYLRQLAVEAIVGHWDGYSYNMNNYYLYDNPETGKLVFIPYDMDNSWGIDWLGVDWTSHNLLNWATSKYKTPLTTRILSVPSYRTQYVNYLFEIINKWFRIDYIEPIVLEKIELLFESVQRDVYFPKTFGYTASDFNQSYAVATGGHVVYSIHDYVQNRHNSAINQLPIIDGVESTAKAPLYIYPNPSNGHVVYFNGNESALTSISLFDSFGRSIHFKYNSINSIEFENQLSNGIYIAKVGTMMYKFMVYKE